MATIRTSKGDFHYRQSLPALRQDPIDHDRALDVLRSLGRYLDHIGINWGPAFGTLLGIIRDNDFLPWAAHIDIYILKEDEERFKDVLFALSDAGFELQRYERRGMYVLLKDGISVVIYVMRKISADVRHSGGSDFLFDKYLRDTVKWDFRGVSLNVPAEVDEYLTDLYDYWPEPRRYGRRPMSAALGATAATYVKDHLPDSLYYPLILRYHRRHFSAFRSRCALAGKPLPGSVELSYFKPRKGMRVLTVGVYDLLHKGHIELFRRARALGDHLTVAVQDGDMILRFKPQAKVLNSTDDRLCMVRAIRYVDEAITYTSVDDIVRKADFDIFVAGPDQNHEAFQKAIRWCEENGKEFIILARTDGVSSSELKEKIARKTGAPTTPNNR